MLEQQEMVLRPAVGAQARTKRAWTWLVVDARNANCLGSARGRFVTGPAWLRWLAQPIVEVYESEDEPLLFTVKRLWSLWPQWEVRDADGHGVGLLSLPWIRDGYGRPLALLQRSLDGGAMRIRDYEGHTLATLTRTAESLYLSFDTLVARHPFAKMLLLAAVLVDEMGQ